jgi:hypothetical protein
VEAARMIELDQSRKAGSPTAWTADHVRDRLVEAFEIERRMPGDRRYTATGTWPATPLHTWQEMVHWDDARDRVLDQWERASGAYPIEVSMMEEAIDWLRWVPLNERRALEAWAKAKAKGIAVRRMIRGQWPVTTFYRLCDHALATIADRLNKQGVQLRVRST